MAPSYVTRSHKLLYVCNGGEKRVRAAVEKGLTAAEDKRRKDYVVQRCAMRREVEGRSTLFIHDSCCLCGLLCLHTTSKWLQQWNNKEIEGQKRYDGERNLVARFVQLIPHPAVRLHGLFQGAYKRSESTFPIGYVLSFGVSFSLSVEVNVSSKEKPLEYGTELRG